MMLQHYLKIADVVVSWWPRQAEIYKTMMGKKSRIEVVPMGVDKTFWTPVETRGKWTGTPSLLTAENCHYIKWPLDLFTLWPWVFDKIPNATLHAHYLPRDQHKWFMPMINSSGAAYKMFTSAMPLAPADLKNAFASTDFYIGLVRYGDFNRICLEAKACGAKVISYSGNEYSDYWLPEGDQRVMQAELVKILKGEVEPRQTKPVDDISVTVEMMKGIYESL